MNPLKNDTNVLIRVVNSPADTAGTVDVRRQVFVLEQGVPEELEMDDLDACAIHLAAVSQNRVVGTARLFAEDRVWHIGRVAVLPEWRKRGIGSRLMILAVRTAQDCGAQSIVLHAQLPIIPFYERLGFVSEGPLFEEAGILHRKMRWRPET